MQGRPVVGWLDWRTRGAHGQRAGRSVKQEPYADHKLVTATNQNTFTGNEMDTATSKDQTRATRSTQAHLEQWK